MNRYTYGTDLIGVLNFAVVAFLYSTSPAIGGDNWPASGRLIVLNETSAGWNRFLLGINQ
jgi:hypothetical protein